MVEWLSDAVGIVGVVLVLLNYWFISSGKLTGVDRRYHIINFSGSSCILFSLMFNWNLSSAVIQVVLIAISIYGFIRATRLAKKN